MNYIPTNLPHNLPDSMRQWILKERPNHRVEATNFELVHASIPVIQPGELLIRVLYLGLAPVMLRYMRNETSFEKPLALGDVMMGRGVGEVIKSNHPDYRPGDIIQAKMGWREYAVVNANDPYYLIYRMQHTDLPLSHGISSLAMSGFTALIGMRDIGRVTAENRVLVSGAAGGVGSQCAMVAKALGATQVVGLAGSSTKCSQLTDQLGYDAAINYKSDSVEAQLDRLFPDGIDVYFDNVGGKLLDDVLLRINRRARIVICGRISEYLLPIEQYHAFKNIYRIGLQDAKMEAFFVYDYTSYFSEYEATLANWIRAGKLSPCEHILHGIEQMPRALMNLYDGVNIGVMMVKL